MNKLIFGIVTFGILVSLALIAELSEWDLVVLIDAIVAVILAAGLGYRIGMEDNQ